MDVRPVQSDLPEDPQWDQAAYDAWKRAKIERGLEQSRDRPAMISVEQLWRDLKLED